jgi:hypothetical protein
MFGLQDKLLGSWQASQGNGTGPDGTGQGEPREGPG